MLVKTKTFKGYDNKIDEINEENVDVLASLDAQAKEEEKGIKDYDELIEAAKGNDYIIRCLNDIRTDEMRHVERLHELVKNGGKDPYAQPEQKPEVM